MKPISSRQKGRQAEQAVVEYLTTHGYEIEHMPKKVARYEQADYGIKGQAMFDVVAVVRSHRRYIQVKNTSFVSTNKIVNANEVYMQRHGHNWMTSELWQIKDSQVRMHVTEIHDMKVRTLEKRYELRYVNGRIEQAFTCGTATSGGY